MQSSSARSKAFFVDFLAFTADGSDYLGVVKTAVGVVQ